MGQLVGTLQCLSMDGSPIPDLPISFPAFILFSLEKLH